MADAIADKKPGDEVEVEYYRGDDKKTATVKLGKRPDERCTQSAPSRPTTARPSDRRQACDSMRP